MTWCRRFETGNKSINLQGWIWPFPEMACGSLKWVVFCSQQKKNNKNKKRKHEMRQFGTEALLLFALIFVQPPQWHLQHLLLCSLLHVHTKSAASFAMYFSAVYIMLLLSYKPSLLFALKICLHQPSVKSFLRGAPPP